MARAIARSVGGRVDVDDLIGAGNLGLTAAANRFDGDEQLFRLYAERCIRGAIRDQLRGLDALSRQERRRVRAMQRAERALSQRLGRAPEPDDVARELGVASEAVEQQRSAADFRVDSLDADPLDCRDTSPESLVIERDTWQRIGRAIRRLPARERTVVEQTCLADARLGAVGKRLGVTASRVSQLRTRALTQLRGDLDAPRADYGCAA